LKVLAFFRPRFHATFDHDGWAFSLGDGAPAYQRFRTSDIAKEQALAQCRATSNSCKIVAQGESGCVASATNGKRWTVATGGSRTRADARALDACSAKGGTCKIVDSFCGQ
jgi:hypothetical protein